MCHLLLCLLVSSRLMVYSQKTGATFPLETAGIASAAGGYGTRPNAGQYDINPYGGATAMHPSMVNIIFFLSQIRADFSDRADKLRL